jgi:hypothetical protein
MHCTKKNKPLYPLKMFITFIGLFNLIFVTNSFGNTLPQEHTQPYKFELTSKNSGMNWGEEISNKGKFIIYEQLRKSILKGELGLNTFSGFNYILTTDKEKSEAKRLLNMLNNCAAIIKDALISSNKDCGQNSLANLYHLLITAKPNADLLYDYLKIKTAAMFQDVDVSPSLRGRIYSWRGGYLIGTTLTAYQSTKQERFLILAMEAMKKIDSTRDDRLGIIDEFRGRIVKSWSSSHFAKNTIVTSPVTYAGRVAAPMARFAWIVTSDSKLDEKYGEAATQLLNSATIAISEYSDEFIIDPSGQYGYYWRVLKNRIEPLNHQAAVGRALLYISKVTKSPKWNKHSLLLARFFKAVIYNHDEDHAIWEYSPTLNAFKGGKPEAVWKAHVTTQYLMQAEYFGVEFDRGDLESITLSFNDYVMRSGEISDINAMLSPKYTPLSNYEHKYSGYANLIPFIALKKYNKKTAHNLVKLISTNPKMGYWFHHPKLANAYALRLADTF